MYELINSTAIFTAGVDVFKSHMPVSWIFLGIVFLIFWEIVYIIMMKYDTKPRNRSWEGHCIGNKIAALMASVILIVWLPLFLLFLLECLIWILIALGAAVLITCFFKLNITIGKAVGKEKEEDDFPNAKFQDGERVRVKKNLDDIYEYRNWRGHYNVGSKKKAIEGKIVTIIDHDDEETFHVRELPPNYHLQDCVVEKLKKSKKKSKVKKG